MCKSLFERTKFLQMVSLMKLHLNNVVLNKMLFTVYDSELDAS